MKVSVKVFHTKHDIVQFEFFFQIMYKFQYHTDINECTEGGHNCSRTQCCVDTIGSYVCQCREGFEPTNNGLDCVGTYTSVGFNLCTT